ncbi:MAG: radical SAM protein [Clostridia bacterium]|nr:radical SAM protein [Clostridia bacterium]
MEPVNNAYIRRGLQRKCAGLGIPVSGTFELTPRCNLSCKMCYVRLTPAEMRSIGRERTAEEWLSLAKDARDAGMVFLLLTGGEPTMREDFPLLYKELARMGLSISINTNGTLLSPELRQVWHDSHPAQVNITLYGTCREDYAALCGNPDAFDGVLTTLDWLRDEGILIHLNTTIVPQNRHRFLALEEFAKSRDLELRMTNYCFPPVRRAGCDSACEFARLSPEEAGQIMVDDIYFREGIRGIRRNLDDTDGGPLNPCELDMGDPIRCMAGRSQFWMTWDGRMLSCGMLDTPAARPFETGFADAWASLREECAKIRLCPDCVNCPDQKTCMNCAAVIYTETGRFDGKPEYMCRMNRAYKAALRKCADAHAED